MLSEILVNCVIHIILKTRKLTIDSLHNLPKVTQLVNDKVRFEASSIKSQGPIFFQISIVSFRCSYATYKLLLPLC